MSHLLEIRNLTVRFSTDDGVLVAVDNVSLALDRGEILVLVGESGCGKSATAMSIPRLLPSTASIAAEMLEVGGEDILKKSDSAMPAIRGKSIGVIFQEPMTALSPLRRIGNQIEEAITLHRAISRSAAKELALQWLDKVDIPREKYDAWPHELSGGMQQRVMIAMALVNDPKLIIADEPTTALDVITQAQILRLLLNLITQKSGMLLITHDMSVIKQVARESSLAVRVAVMYAGQVVEFAAANELLASPRHPYTRALLAALPGAETKGGRLPVIPGQVPSPLDWPSGCRFRERCPHATTRCSAPPPFAANRVRCHLVN